MYFWSLPENSFVIKEVFMFGNIYWKYILRSVRDKELVIWTFLFPILLSTLFYFSIGSIDKAEMFTSIPIAVVADERLKKEIYLEKLLDTLSDGEDAILEIVQTKDVQEADALLRDDRVEGFITVENGAPKLYVKENGIYQTILKNILNRYIQTKDTVMAVIEKNPASALEFAKDIRENWEDMGAGIEQLQLSKEMPSSTVHYYYALLAMVCLYGGFHGVTIVSSLQANLSPQGARNTLSPGNRGILFWASYLAALTIQFICMLGALCYIRFILKINFGSQFGYALATCLAGSMVGIAFGSLISMPARWKGGVKVGIVVGVSMICCFLAGLMVGGLNYQVEENLPVLAMINPASRIADAFYCLYYYEDHVRYFRDMGILLVMTAVLLSISIVFARRKQYESI